MDRGDAIKGWSSSLGRVAFRLLFGLAQRVGQRFGYSIVRSEIHDVLPRNQYDYVPKGTYVFGPADRFLLVPKNRYRVTLLPGQPVTDDLGVGWVTEENTPEGYNRLWGSSTAIDAYKAEAAGVRARMPYEIVAAVRDTVENARAVCDIGCGVGDLLAVAVEINPAIRLAGLDFSEAAVQRTRERFPEAQLQRHVIVDSLPFPSDEFDVVFCTDVLEHIEQREALVAELVRICAPGGQIVIVVPDGDVDQFFGHLWFFNEERLAAFLKPWHATVHRLPDCREFIARITKSAPENSHCRGNME
jgi:ubiquinone/menaquinone biosynthesis C-methylase UbiE